MSVDLAVDNKRLRETLKEWQHDYNTLLDEVESVENMTREAVTLLREWVQDGSAGNSDHVHSKTRVFLQTVNLEQLQSEASVFINWTELETVRGVQDTLDSLRKEQAAVERAVAETEEQRQDVRHAREALEASLQSSQAELTRTENDCRRQRQELEGVHAEVIRMRDTLSTLEADCDDKDRLCRIKAEHLAEIKSSIQAELTRQFHLKAESTMLLQQNKAMRQTRSGAVGALCAMTAHGGDANTGEEVVAGTGEEVVAGTGEEVVADTGEEVVAGTGEDAKTVTPQFAPALVNPDAHSDSSDEGAWHHLHKDLSTLQETLRCAETEVLALFDMASVDALD